VTRLPLLPHLTRLTVSRGTPARGGRTAAASLLITALTAVTAACSSGAYAPTAVPKASTATAPATTAPSPSAPAPGADQCLASYRPSALPPPGKGSGTTLAAIYKRGRLKAGVSADTLLLGARNPLSGSIEGFDIDMLRAISTALFGRPDRVTLTVLTAAQRIPALESGKVDVVARNMTINCDRWKQVAFSSEYYRAGQKLLVPSGSPIRSRSDLGGKRVCAPTGSTSLTTISQVPGVVPVAADTHTACLILFQQSKVDAITGDDTVLAGLSAQDPYAEVVGSAFSTEPYGLAMAQDHVDLVRFVNAVLTKIRADGTWTKDYDRWLKAPLGPAPAPPKPVYGRTP
jgi:polar amino acid transport system substrate-binding protein